MAPKVKLTAALFQERYGNLVSEQFARYTTARTLRVALSERKPPIIVTDGMLKIWFANFRLPSDAVTVSSAEELHRRYGDILPALANVEYQGRGTEHTHIACWVHEMELQGHAYLKTEEREDFK